MHIALHHRFDAPLEAVLASLSSPAYPRYLAARHSFFAEIEPLSLAVTRTRVVRTLRYRARPFITRLGVFSLPPAWFVWIEHSVLDRTSSLLTFENVPEVTSVKSKVVNRGTMQLRARRSEQGEVYTARESRFELAFMVAPMYRPLAELALSMVARQLGSALDEEAQLLGGWLTEARSALKLTA